MEGEKKNYPQIPASVWWGVRAFLQTKPTATFDEKLLATSFSVQKSAANTYLKQLQFVGLLDENGKATDIAQKWRMDSTYKEAAGEILENTYPESLRNVCPPEQFDRDKAIDWFMLEGLGKGSAGNKAATYALLSSLEPQSPSSAPAKSRAQSKSKQANLISSLSKSSEKPQKTSSTSPNGFAGIPLNVNVQVHISADATSQQIDQIFKSMRKHLYDGDS